MARQDGRIEPGQPLSQAISARAWNRAMDAADYVMSGRGLAADSQMVNGWPREWVWARNYTDGDLGQFSAVELSDLDEVINGSNQAQRDAIKRGHVLSATVPKARAPWTSANSNDNGMVDIGTGGFNGYPPPPRWGVCIEPIPYLAIGKVAVSGVVPAFLTLGPGLAQQTGGSGTGVPTFGSGYSAGMFTWPSGVVPISTQGEAQQKLLGNLRVTVANGSTTAVVDLVGEADVVVWGGAVGGTIAAPTEGWSVIRFGAPSPPPILAAAYSGEWANGTMKTVVVSQPGYYDPPLVRAINLFDTIRTTGTNATVTSVSVACVNNRWQLLSVPPKKP